MKEQLVFLSFVLLVYSQRVPPGVPTQRYQVRTILILTYVTFHYREDWAY